jgi:hypothetical protein
MSTYDKISWLPLCGGLSGLGLILSYLVMRRRGLGAGLRGVAWSALPMAAYLTGAIEMFWKMGVAIGDFATGFVFSPRVWSGIALAGLAVVLFMVSGPLRRRQKETRRQDKQAAGTGAGTAGGVGATRTAELAPRTPGVPAASAPAKAPVKARKGKAAAAADDDDLGDVADILRRHGIN